MANTSFPDSAVVYILDDIPGQGEFQGTGVIIGPHTILTAAHLLYDADTDVKADAISLYPGFTPDAGTYNPPGALGGSQTIHGIKVDDRNDELSAEATQRDFAIIDTSVDLSAYGSFALDPSFISGDVVAKGYPASNGGHLDGVEGVVSRDGALSDIGTTALPLSPGYSGGPLYDTVERNGRAVEAVVGTVSTADDAMKLTPAKVALIRRWVASDQSLIDGTATSGLVPQLPGTVSGRVDAAAVGAPSGSSTLAAAMEPASASMSGTAAGTAAGAEHPRHGASPASAGQFADLVNALHGSAWAGDGADFVHHGADGGVGFAGPSHAADHWHHGHGGGHGGFGITGA